MVCDRRSLLKDFGSTAVFGPLTSVFVVMHGRKTDPIEAENASPSLSCAVQLQPKDWSGTHCTALHMQNLESISATVTLVVERGVLT